LHLSEGTLRGFGSAAGSFGGVFGARFRLLCVVELRHLFVGDVVSGLAADGAGVAGLHLLA
jgi:hypothetical protein